ncbi:MAG: hypothetical protein Q7R98_00200 [Candidatus Jorgensenbacteria bacterium]|nr:hypothetical protein [Candidatus Jorgensenbacteria bacterium]
MLIKIGGIDPEQFSNIQKFVIDKKNRENFALVKVKPENLGFGHHKVDYNHYHGLSIKRLIYTVSIVVDDRCGREDLNALLDIILVVRK